MSDPEKSRWQTEYDALPGWAQALVKAAQKATGYGYCSCGGSGASNCYVTLPDGEGRDWSDGIDGLMELAEALTAPWPPLVVDRAEPSAFNLVEILAGDEDDNAFDQPCAFGHRVDGHAVYCHHPSWPNRPRKCRRNRDDYRHEDCPGFSPNPTLGEQPCLT